jgi:Tripartite tricarboxylate transporter TctB family
MTTPHRLQPVLSVTGSVLLFALLIENAGLVPAVAATVVVASVGSRNGSVREAFLLAAVLAVGMSLLFVGLLDQPFTLFPGF